MQIAKARHGLRLLGAGLCLSLVAAGACSGPRGGAEQAPPTPAFHAITDEQLESAMWQLADGILDLQALFARPKPIRQSERQDVVDILDRMILAADTLGPDGVSTNHRRITHNLGRFREKLAIARDAAASNPPRYFLVGNLSGTCLACHASE